MEKCKWTQDLNDYEATDHNIWHSDCDHYFCLEEGTPEDNGMNYCSYCGKKLKQVIIPFEEDNN